ncbi:MAG: cohesin domain-containing protein, partial [Bacteroidota bacterium]
MDFTLSVSSDSVAANEDFCVSLSVENFTNILGIEFILTYDPAQLQFNAIQNLNLTGLNQSAFGRPGEGANALGELKVSWFDSQVSGITVVDGTVIFEVCFRALTNDVTSTIGFQNPEIIDINENIITFVGETSNVVVGNGGSGPSNSGGNSNGFTVTVGDGTVTQGQQICLPVSVDGFDDILGVELLFTHDPAKFQYNMVQALNLTGLNASAFGEPGVGANPNNQLKLSWFDQTVSGVSVSDGTVIFELCYTALTDNTTGTVAMSGAEIIDSGENIIPFNGNSGTITVGTGSGGSNSGTGDFMVTVSDEMTQQGQEVCAGVSVQGFTDILGIELVFSFDPTKLQYSEVKNFNLSGLNGSAFGEPGVGANPNNQLKLSWFDQQVAGVTLSDNTTIFDVCFNAIGDNTSDQITMSNAEIIDVNEDIVSFSGNPGTITIGTNDNGGNNNGGNTGTGNADDFTVEVGDAATQQGQEVCLPVTVNNFDDILGIELVFNFDPIKLQYEEVKGFNLDGLNASAFGEPGVGANPNNQLKLSWFDQQVAGVTLTDNTSIFELCFTALANNTTDVVSMNQAEIIDSGENIIAFNGVSGTVTIGDNQTGGGNDPVEITMSNANVEPEDNFCLGVSVNDFTDLSSVEFTIDYDPQLLTFTEVKDFNLSGLSSSDFDLPGQGGNAAGSIVMSWADMGSNGISVADGTVIFQTCFQAGASNGTSSISFTNQEVIDSANNMVTPTLNAGTVTIQSTNTGSQDLTISIGDGMVE